MVNTRSVVPAFMEEDGQVTKKGDKVLSRKHRQWGKPRGGS